MAEKRIAILKRANKLFRQGKADAAVKEYKRILSIKPDDLEVRRIIGDLELRQNNVHGAVEQFEWIGDHYLKEGFFAKAIAMYKRITRVEPGYETALFKLGDLYTKQGLVMEAKQIYLDIAEECKRQNNQKKALDMYKKILEFDRSNIKMRLLLADNYLKERLEDDAVNEYVIAADILINKKDYPRVEELLLNTLKKIQHVKIIEKLIFLYTQQGEDDKAIALLKDLGLDVFKNVDLLKSMGELYLKKNLINEAEVIFSKIAEIDPHETEVIMRLGKVYMQREEYDKTYKLFLPFIDKNIQIEKYEEAANMLRFIIASNNTYVPALNKLAAIFKASKKTNNLIALYESMLPIYEQKGMKTELKEILEELIRLSDTPFSYEEQLAKLAGQEDQVETEIVDKEQAEKEDEQERDFLNYNMRAVDESLKLGDYQKAADILKKSKNTFPRNIEVRERLFEVYRHMDSVDMAVEEGKGLLELYRYLNRDDDYAELLEKLSILKPEDEKLVALSGDEKTNIELEVDREALKQEISDDEYDGSPLEESDVLVLSPDESMGAMDEVEVGSSPLAADADLEADLGAAAPPGAASTKSLSSVLAEVDFYVNDGYFGDAEKLIEKLKAKYPGNKELLDKMERLRQAKSEAMQKGESASGSTSAGFVIERSKAPGVKGHTERLGQNDPVMHDGADSNIEIDIDNFELESAEAPSSPGLNLADSGGFQLEDAADEESKAPSYPPGELELENPEPGQLPGSEGEGEFEDMFELEPSLSHPSYPPEQEISPPRDKAEDSSMLKISEKAYAGSDSGFLEAELDEEPLELSQDENIFEIEPPGGEAPAEVPQEKQPPAVNVKSDGSAEAEAPAFELELEEPEDMAVLEGSEEPVEDEAASAIDELDLDNIMLEDESASASAAAAAAAAEAEAALPVDDDLDSPFKELSGAELALEENEEDLLTGENLFIDEAFMEVEKNVEDELEAIVFWLKELEKQRTSTIEKNMMEIFEEFKKGVDEKIGKEDYDTRYNLGIAYKEMGLLEEAIHEFLISAKHPSKFFDSAGLLGMCFREKGMFNEAISWFDKALETADRRKEEYLAVKYEKVITLKLKEDFRGAIQMLEEIIKVAPTYRNVVQLHGEIKALFKR